MLMKALDTKYSVSALLFLSERYQCFMKDLYSVATRPNTLDKLLGGLQTAGLVAMKEEMRGRRTYLITLTPTGKRVAKKLKETDGMLNRGGMSAAD